MRLYCIRHGQSVGNVQKLYFQPSDEALSELGVHQANIVAKRLQKVQIDEIITSDYTRAQQTGEIINKKLKKKISHTPLLRERTGNSLLKDLPWDNPAVQEYFQKLKTAKDMNFKEHDEETVQELFDRAAQFLDFVSKRDASHIAVVTHGIFLNTLAQLVTIGKENINASLSQHFFAHTWVSNTGITVFEEWTPGDWYMLTWNDHAHLS